MFIDDKAERLRGEDAVLVDDVVASLGKLYARVYAQDNMIVTGRSVAFQHEPEFARAFAAVADNPHAHRLMWRMHTLAWAARNAMAVGGDFVECGVFRAFKSAFLMDLLRFDQTDRHFWLYDTFAGVPAAQRGPDTISSAGHQVPGIADQVRARFAHQPRVHVVEGMVPNVLVDGAPERVGFLHLDMNSAIAELGALEFFWDRMVPGGTVVLDDYGWSAFRPQLLAADGFFHARGYTVLELPTGQGMVTRRP